MEKKGLRVGFASDHRGVGLKFILCDYLRAAGCLVTNFGTNTADPVDYPDYAKLLTGAMASGTIDYGVLICGSGTGMCMAANRHPGIRAALCHDLPMTTSARLHNDANVLVLGAEFVQDDMALECLRTFLETPFEGGRHAKRIAKLG